jgi:bifunctional UDP-N-acetylglucosamine pyrophosphorylase/glucosamine-1-phosphate N-acetyltransferase
MSARAIVLAAGKGTRMKSSRPKVLHELCGRPMLWYVLDAVRAAGASEIVVVASGELEARLEGLALPAGVKLHTVVQEPQLGTGHAVKVALDGLPAAEGALLIAYGDMPLVPAETYRRVLDSIAGDDSRVALALTTARMPLPSNFGRIVQRGPVLERIVEARDCSPEELEIDEMNAGIYAYDEAALRGVIGALSNENAQGEYYLTDTVELLIAGGKRVIPVREPDYRVVLGINDRVELSEAAREMNRRLCEQHMRNGVTIVDPATTYLEPELTIATDVTLEPNTRIGGRTSIGTRTSIGPNTRIAATTIGADVKIADSVIEDATIGDRVSIGPFAHLRGGATLTGEVHIGNFVEVKNSRLEPGVKASHLSYLGDATIGRGTNVGAGTITCNYDGTNKNRTEIGENVFIGSNSSLVAPLRIGDGALTGAGSVVVRDVEAGERVAGNPAKPLKKKAPV